MSKQSVMLPRITGKSELPGIEGVRDRRVMEAYGGHGVWIVSITHYRCGEKKKYKKEALVLCTSELDELCRWWSGVREATK